MTMTTEIKIMKFENLITTVDKRLQTDSLNVFSGYPMSMNKIISGEVSMNLGLALIFDYDKLNEYGKFIMKNSFLELRISEPGELRNFKVLKDNSKKIKAAKYLIKDCQKEYNSKNAYKFIFWAMMVLAVDQTNSEEYLSIICDYSRLLKISDDEMEDLFAVVRCIFNDKEEPIFKSKIVPEIFKKALEK